MPNRDGSGPTGRGPGTGWGRGPCRSETYAGEGGRGAAWGRGRGEFRRGRGGAFGRNFGRGFGRRHRHWFADEAAPDRTDEVSRLREQVAELEARLRETGRDD